VVSTLIPVITIGVEIPARFVQEPVTV
jgi:hypothetical protein